MPWKETEAVKERMKFIVAVAESEEDFASICRAFGISRTTGYKWVARFEEELLTGLEDRPRARRTQGHATPDEVVFRLVSLRKEHPTWGPRKLRQYLLDRPCALGDGELVVPAASTIGDILKRHGLVRPRRRRPRVAPQPGPVTEPTCCNDVWTTDFKGQRRLGDRTMCYPLTVVDLFSRFLLKSECLPGTASPPVKRHFELLFREFGLPARIRSDNGVPFATSAAGGFSDLSLWWVKLGIVPERIDKGKPQQNGAHERMHRTLEEDAFKEPRHSMMQQQLAFDAFRAEYNGERPHEGIGMRTPGSVYVPSVREYRGQERSPEYDEGVDVRQVQRKGHVKWKGEFVHVGKLFVHEPVGFVACGEDAWQVFYGPYPLLTVTMRGKELRVDRHPKRSEPQPSTAAEAEPQQEAEA